MAEFGEVEALQEAASSMFLPLCMTAPRDTPFHAEVTDASVGPVTIARVDTTPGAVRRTPRLIGSDDRQLVKVVLQRRGNVIVTQDDRQCQVKPGNLVVYDMNEPYEYLCPDPASLIIIAMPWPMLGPSGDLFKRRKAIPISSDHGIRSVIAAFFSGLADTAVGGDGDELRGPDAIRLADTAASLLITAVTETAAERVELPTELATRILSYALASLHDPGLSVGSVARQFGISPRYLHKLMQDRGIRFGAWLRRERMNRIRRDLLDPRLANWTTAAIAARWGIRDPGHLSRSLRAEFGHSAAEIRAAGQPS
ncbi:MAG: helix-turn-helix domain-containing protein [Nocardiopsaceae bacterium]|nr:helix-turn-helix domain-containing protein [Nocardiopsaceae bacterium]